MKGGGERGRMRGVGALNGRNEGGGGKEGEGRREVGECGVVRWEVRCTVNWLEVGGH